MASNPKTKRQKTTSKRKPDEDDAQSPSGSPHDRKKARRTKKVMTLDQTDIQEVTRNKEVLGLKIENELHRTLLGSFRMSASSLHFQWKGSNTTEQRRVSTDHVKKMLTHFYTSGLRRCAKEHHISAIINRRIFDEAVQLTIRNKEIDPLEPKSIDEPEPVLSDSVTAPRADSEGMTENDRIYHAMVRYPPLILPAGVTVEAQSGQHRIHALRQLFTEERDKWWVIDLYDDTIDKTAKEKLRMNIPELQKPPSLAETWANLLVYQQENDHAATNATLATMKSPIKVKQLLFFEQYRNAITQTLRNRGVWKMFTAGRFSLFLPMRCVEENVRYLTRAAKIWDYIGEGIPEFHESIDEQTLKHVEGLAPARFVEDARSVEEGMEGNWFFKIADKGHRALIKSRIKSIDYRILSLNTFWEDIRSMSYFSRIMADVAFWISEEFAAAARTGATADHSLASTFQVEGFKPVLVYRKLEYPQLVIRGGKLVPLSGPRLPDNVYRACAYTQVWLFVIRNFFSLHKALNPKPNDSGVEPLPWVVSGTSFSDDMSEQQIEMYNNRFCIPEWKDLWEFSKALGFYPSYAEAIGIGPRFCKLPPIPGQNPQAMSKLNDMTQLGLAIRTIRPAVSEPEITNLCEEFIRNLPQLTGDELRSFGEVCPRTHSIIRRSGSIDGVWLPEFQESHKKIDYTIMSSTGKVPIQLDADETSMSWFVKRDFIWSFLRPFKTAEPIFGPRELPWPPPLQKRNPAGSLCDDDMLGAYMDDPGSLPGGFPGAASTPPMDEAIPPTPTSSREDTDPRLRPEASGVTDMPATCTPPLESDALRPRLSPLFEEPPSLSLEVGDAVPAQVPRKPPSKKTFNPRDKLPRKITAPINTNNTRRERAVRNTKQDIAEASSIYIYILLMDYIIYHWMLAYKTRYRPPNGHC